MHAHVPVCQRRSQHANETPLLIQAELCMQLIHKKFIAHGQVKDLGGMKHAACKRSPGS
jgi:hypothetical protein